MLCAASRLRVKAINPEDGVIDTITDAIRRVVFGNLHHPAAAEHTQSRIVKGGRPATSATPIPVWSIVAGSSISYGLAGCFPYNFKSTKLIARGPEHRGGERKSPLPSGKRLLQGGHTYLIVRHHRAVIRFGSN